MRSTHGELRLGNADRTNYSESILESHLLMSCGIYNYFCIQMAVQ